jgi:hypothetical protein
MHPAEALYNNDRGRCAALADSLARVPVGSCGADRNTPTLFERAWLRLAFPHERFPQIAKKASLWCAGIIERSARNSRAKRDKRGDEQWCSPLVTRCGVELLPFLLHSVPTTGKRLIYRLLVCGDETSRMTGAWQVFRRSFHDGQYGPLADALANEGVIYRRLVADIASSAATHDDYRDRAERILKRGFSDVDEAVRQQAAGVFREIKPAEFFRYKTLADDYLNSKAFGVESWAFFHALDEAECKVDDIVISASEIFITDIERNGNTGGRRSSDLHQLQDILKKEYAASESHSELRGRLLDLIDKMLLLELHGVDSIITAHER